MVVSITVPIIVLVLVAIAVFLGVLGCVTYFKRRNNDLPFQFKYMRDGDDLDDLQTLDAQPENCEFEPSEKSDLGAHSMPHEDVDRYEKPNYINSGTVV